MDGFQSFTFMIGHEINQPIINMAWRERDWGEQNEQLQKTQVYSHVIRDQRYISDILEKSTLEVGEMTYKHW